MYICIYIVVDNNHSTTIIIHNHSLYTATTQVYFRVSFFLKKDNANCNTLQSLSHVVVAFLSVLLFKCFLLILCYTLLLKDFKNPVKCGDLSDDYLL